MDLKHGTPSCDAFSDLSNSLNPVELGVVLPRLAQSRAEGPVVECGDGVIAVDGKTLRRSFADASKRHPPHPACAFASDTRLALAQTAVDGKSNEIKAIPALLKFLDIRGRTAAAGAVHAQLTISEAVKDGGGEFRGVMRLEKLFELYTKMASGKQIWVFEIWLAVCQKLMGFLI